MKTRKASALRLDINEDSKGGVPGLISDQNAKRRFGRRTSEIVSDDAMPHRSLDPDLILGPIPLIAHLHADIPARGNRCRHLQIAESEHYLAAQILAGIVGKDLVPVCQHGSIFGSLVPLYPDSEKIVNFTQANLMAEIMGKARALIMRGHGAVVADNTVEAVFIAAHHLEENAQLWVEASAIGTPKPLPEEEIKRAAAGTFQPKSIQKGWTYYLAKGQKQGIFWD